MPLSDQDRHEIRQEIREGLRTELKDQGIEWAEHAKDHEFITAWRYGSYTVRKTGLKVVTGVVLTGLLGLVWCYVTGKVQ